MARIEVDYGALVRHGETLRAVAEDLDSAHHRVESLRSQALGSRSVDAALNYFAGRWDYGMSLLVSEVEEAGCALLTMAAVYQRLEAAVAAGFAEGVPLGPPAPAPQPRFPPRVYGPEFAIGTWKAWKKGGAGAMLPNAAAIIVDIGGPAAAPLATGGNFESGNIAGIKDVRKLPSDIHDLLVNGPEPEPSPSRLRSHQMREVPPLPVMED